MDKFERITAIFFYKRFGIKKFVMEMDYYLKEWIQRIKEAWLNNGIPSLAFDSHSAEVFIEIYNEYNQ